MNALPLSPVYPFSLPLLKLAAAFMVPLFLSLAVWAAPLDWSVGPAVGQFYRWNGEERWFNHQGEVQIGSVGRIEAWRGAFEALGSTREVVVNAAACVAAPASGRGLDGSVYGLGLTLDLHPSGSFLLLGVKEVGAAATRADRGGLLIGYSFTFPER